MNSQSKNNSSITGILGPKKLARSFIYMMSSTGVALVLSLLITVSLARLTTPVELGVILTAEAFIEMFNFFLYFGFGNAILRVASDYAGGFEKGIAKAVGNALLIKVVTSIPLVAIIYLLGLVFLKDQMIIDILGLYIFIYIFESWANVFGIARRAIGQFKLMSFIQILNKILRLANIYIVLKYFGGIKLLVITFLIEKIIRFFISAWTTLKYIKPEIDLTLLKPMLKHCFGYAFIDPLSGVQGRLDRLLLNKFIGPVAVAIYSIPVKFSVALSSVHQSVTQVFAPTLHQSFSSDPELYKSTTKHLSRFLAIIGAFVFICIFYFGETILLKVFGDKYAASVSIVYFVAYISLLDFLDRPCDLVLASQASHRNRIFTKATALVITVGLNLWLIPSYGIQGVVWATIISGIIKLIISYKFVHDAVETWKCLLVVAFPALLANFMSIYILVPLFLAYLALAKLITKEDIDFTKTVLKLRKKKSTIQDPEPDQESLV